MSERTLGTELSGIRALVLDVDDTIVDTRGAMVAAGAVAAAALWPDHVESHVAMAERYHADPARWFRRYAAGDVAFETMRARRLDEVAAAFGVVLPEAARARFEAAYQPAFRSAQRLFPDVPGLLEAAAHRDLPVGLLTNSAAAPTKVKLAALELTERFDVVVTTDTLGVGKPDPRVYFEVCRLLGTAPEMAVCIGDSLERDVHGARRAGLRALWLDRVEGVAPGDGAVRRGFDAALAGDLAEGATRVRSLDEVTAALLASGPGRFGAAAVDR